MLTQLVDRPVKRFVLQADWTSEIRQLVSQSADISQFLSIGSSEAGREMYAVILGSGPRRISLIAGAHADEPVGPMTLATLITGILHDPQDFADLLEQYTFIIIPHVNPDGEAANAPWIGQWPDPCHYILNVIREAPGRDVEFGYPSMRLENENVHRLLAAHAPFDLHTSLHGMAVAEGAMLLIERHWVDRTADLRARFAEALASESMPLFDYDRAGEKGFHYIQPGFSTTPEGSAMRDHFSAMGDHETAKHFADSSMEAVRKLGGDPLCLVTEIPLFILRNQVVPFAPGKPNTFFKFRAISPQLRNTLQTGGSIDETLHQFGLESVDIAAAIRLQLRAIELGIAAIETQRKNGK